MKLYLFLASLLLSLSAQAQTTVTLGPDSCGLNRQCVSIPNDNGADFSLYAYPAVANQYLYIDGVQYAGPQGSPSVLYSSTGAWVTLTTSWSTYRTCTHSGKGQHCSTHWQLTGGTVVLPVSIVQKWPGQD